MANKPEPQGDDDSYKFAVEREILAKYFRKKIDPIFSQFEGQFTEQKQL